MSGKRDFAIDDAFLSHVPPFCGFAWFCHQDRLGLSVRSRIDCREAAFHIDLVF